MPDTRPDIIWIYCDELRCDALQCYGHPTMTLHTPNLDRLAAMGVRFTNNFCNSPVCVPSRMCVLTGMTPEQTGVYNNEGAWKCFRMPALPDTFPEVFARNGYRTANFGKLHVARELQPDVTPGREIFQVCEREGGRMHIWQHLGEERVRMIRPPSGGMNGGVFPDDDPYPPDAVAEGALAWMAEAERPYLCRFSILQPHTPVLPPARFVRMLADQDPGLPPPLPETVSAFERRVAETHRLTDMDPEQLRACRLHYYAQVAWIDEQVGRVLEFLERTGRLERTVVLFGSDHGNPIGDTWAFEKHTFTPTVHRVPLIVAWPGTIRGGQVRDDICDSLDIPRTLFGMAGIDTPAQFMGRDLFADPPPEAIYSTIGFGEPDSKMGPNGGKGTWYGDRGWPRRSCIRTARWRLDKNMRLDAAPVKPEDEDVFLADMINDRAEMTNLAAEPRCANIVRDLCARLDAHAEGAVVIAHEYTDRNNRR